MGRFFFRLPDIGEGVVEAEIIARPIKIGDHVKEDQPLLDVMTDKATVEMTSPVDGVVVNLHGEIGGMVSVGSILVEFEVDNAENEPNVTACSESAEAEPPVEPTDKTRTEPKINTVSAGKAPPLASPHTRYRAYEQGIDLELVKGTGPKGRILPDDLESHIQRQTSSPHLVSSRKNTAIHDVRIIGLRRKIAEKMQDSKSRIPHFSYIEDYDVTELEGLRLDLNKNLKTGQNKLTLLPFFMRALVKVLPEFPNINARYDDESGVLQTFEGVHIGIATQTPHGLIVPVVHHAEALTIWDCARELIRVTDAARKGTASRDDLMGSTITLSSLGALGGLAATPVINHPEVAIIGPNKVSERPMVRNGQIIIRKMINISSSFDHRIVDGYDAARFIQQLKRLIEHPALIFMD
jgi:2-oxoisovalerate dehydrogenase E2 component (dihydrolipoyl transacylase)